MTPREPTRAASEAAEKTYFVFDVESIGLHGEAFAVGWCVVGSKGSEYEASFLACDPVLAAGTDDARKWCAENIPAIVTTHKTLRGMRDAFWSVWMLWKRSGAVMAADCAWPVEARFLAQCVQDDPAQREWEGPDPLHDVASFVAASGGNPLATNDRLPNELPQHHPMFDARQSARLLCKVLDSATAPLAERVRVLEEDKRRLDWLEFQEEKTGRYIWEHDDPPRSKPYPGGHFIAVSHEFSPFYGETYREAIDAAMKAEARAARSAWNGKKL